MIFYKCLVPLLFSGLCVFAQFSEFNELDFALQSKQTKKTINKPVDDRQFIKRVWLDLTGKLPDLATTEAFIADVRPDKRARVIDELMTSEAFTDRWTHFYGDLFGIFGIRNGLLRDPFHFLIRDMVDRNVGWDQMARAILTNTQPGTSGQSSVFFFARERIMEMSTFLDLLDDHAADISQIMLGVNTLCISCHDGQGHLEDINKGLATITREDFWGLAAFLSKAFPYKPPNDNPRDFGSWAEYRTVDVDNPNAEINPEGDNLFETTKHEYVAQTIYGRPPRNGGLILPRYPFTGETPKPGETRRQALARIITADRQFARNMVNRVWAHFFGRGFVEPLDGWDLGRINSETAAANGVEVQAESPAIMEWLTTYFIEQGYDMRALMAMIANSALYQWDYASETETRGWLDNRRVRRMQAQAIMDGVFQTLGLEHKMLVYNRPNTSYTSTWQLPGTYEPSWYAYFSSSNTAPFAELGYDSEDHFKDTHIMIRGMLEVLGGADRRERAQPVSVNSISTNLALLNNEVFNDWLQYSKKAPIITRLKSDLLEGRSKDDVVREIFLTALFREPTQQELDLSVSHFTGRNLERALRDLVWAMFNHPDFLYK